MNSETAGVQGATALRKLNAQIRALFASAARVVITSHIRPDGDAIGSVLGLGLALEKAGKTVQMALADPIPHPLRFLPGVGKIHRGAVERKDGDLLVVVDSSDLQRTGSVLGEHAPDLNIDHHVTNLEFATTNLVLPDRVATAAILGEFMPAWGLEIDSNIATALLTGLVTDTIGFRTSNMNSATLRLAADLMDRGADLSELYQRALVSKTFEAARYWGQGLVKVQSDVIGNGKPSADDDLRLVWTELSLADRTTAGYQGNDDADLVNVLSSIDTDVAVIFVEQKNGHVKVSWRARAGIDISQIALQFGGGGHPAAAGADITGSLEDVQQQVLRATRNLLFQAKRTTAGE